MNSKQRKTLEAIFADPVRSDIRWNAVVSLFRALGAEIGAGREGSRVRFFLNGVVGTYHKPHPSPIVSRPTVRDLRRHLIEAGVRG
jgi:hypothetical protein